jgi:hypothetical protein
LASIPCWDECDSCPKSMKLVMKVLLFEIGV